MKRVLLALAAAAVVLSPVYANDWTKIQKRVSPSVAYLSVNPGGEDSTMCSAVVVAPETIVTNSHCFQSDDAMFLVGTLPADLLEDDVANDIAALHVNGLKAPALEFSDRRLVPGLPVALAGHALAATQLRFQFGFVADPIGAAENGVLFPLFDLVSLPGDSGGAIVDVDGRLLTLDKGAYGMTGHNGAFAVGVRPDVLRNLVHAIVEP